MDKDRNQISVFHSRPTASALVHWVSVDTGICLSSKNHLSSIVEQSYQRPCPVLVCSDSSFHRPSRFLCPSPLPCSFINGNLWSVLLVSYLGTCLVYLSISWLSLLPLVLPSREAFLVRFISFRVSCLVVWLINVCSAADWLNNRRSGEDGGHILVSIACAEIRHSIHRVCDKM